jgi:uncharacterized membrane protein YedE/YeeE
MTLFMALISGLVFGLGLLISGMANPGKVLSFLDLAHAWDPSLIFVMAGAILVAIPAFALAKGRKKSLCGEPMMLPTNKHIDRNLLIGSAIFGLGWGLAGICPGPALVLVGAGVAKGGIFVLAMLVGMGLMRALVKK